MTSISAGAPVAPRTNRRAVTRMAAGAVILAAASIGLYQGAQAFTAHYQAPVQNVSWANQSTITRITHEANHTPASAGGAFVDGADISGGNVVSVVKAAN